MRADAALSGAEFFERARARLTLDVPAGLTDPNVTPKCGDHDADPIMKKISEVRPIRPAAVLVPVIDHPEPTVLLTQRAQHLPDHPGQVSFPGGKIYKADANPLESALREAHEEIGLHPERAEIIARLPEYHTRTGYRVTPVVGLLQPPLELAPDAREVEEIFEVPLAFLLDPRNHRRETREIQGRVVGYYAMPYGERYIWGATAGMLMNLYRHLLGEPGA